MAYIKKDRITTPRQKNICSTALDNNKYYGSAAWKRLRATFYSEHPCCEECLKRQKITPTEEIHHRKPFGQGATEQDRWTLLLSQDNLVALCRVCHDAIHNKINKYNMNACDSLTDKEWRHAHDIDTNES